MSSIFIQYGLSLALTAFAIGAVLSLLLEKLADEGASSFAAHLCATVGGLCGLAFSGAVLLSGSIVVLHNSIGFGMMQNLGHVRVDGLAALFIGIISTVTIAASLFGIGYQKQFFGTYRVGAFGFFYNLFLASMLLVVSANNGVFFLFAWELMAVTSYFLVIFEHREKAHIQAGTLYILISQIGAGFLFAAFLTLYHFTGSWDFDTIRASAGAIPLLIQNIVLGLALVGFASKAGVIPLHIWLPEAHPAAPSHVSALMSGVMLKIAIFMLVRFFIEFFPAASLYWGLFIIMLGAVSSLLGVLYALSEHDIKRLLAFHSVENIGIILLGLGASITFFALNLPAIGVVALVAALYHTVNHALFKGLLFLSAGSVVHATHTRNMEEYGGLLKVMPWTGAFFLVGAVAISGLPPFNGFVSEWLTFQSLFAGIATLPTLPKIIFLLGATSLAFTGGLAAACFVKAFGVTFLARPRSDVRDHAREAEPVMLVGMGLLAVLTLVFGVGASSIAPMLMHIAGGLRGVTAPAGLVPSTQPLVFGTFASLSMVLVAVALVVGVCITIICTAILSRNRRVVVSRTWDCGAPLTPRMEITATGFSRSLITIFHRLLRSTKRTEVEYHDASVPYFAKTKTVHLSLPDIYHLYIYKPGALFIDHSARHARRIQTGNINTYLLYMFLTLIALLFWALK